MRLLIKQRVFSWTDTFDIYDEQGQPMFFVRGKLFSWGHNLVVYDMNQEEIGSVRQRVVSFMPKFEMYCFGNYLGLIRKELALFRQSYSLDCNGWQVEGDMMGWDYDVVDGGGNVVMSISKELFRWGDTYVIDIADDVNTLPGLLIVLAIDAANCSHND